MQIADAQREMRAVHVGGFAGATVSGLLWLVSAALTTWSLPRRGMGFLIIAGAFIFPLAVLLLRALGHRATLSAENGLRGLAMQIAFTIPLAIPVILGATLYRKEWFYPAFMVIVGAHYLPFIFLYGMWQYSVIAAVLICAGIALGLTGLGGLAGGGWFTGAVLLAFAVPLRQVALSETQRGAGAPGVA